MALRVLLADESTSIKKVMQLSLQDFAVEVKAVPVGVDVIPVAKSWKPDIIFADILLQKKSGYELCSEIKLDPELKATPVVLMWSSFMEIDAAKVANCRSERQLEKPFDADTLRNLVKTLVPRLSSNQISDYLSFPHLPDIVEKELAPTPHMIQRRAEPPSTPPMAKSQIPMPKVATEAFPERMPQTMPQTIANVPAAPMEVDEPEDFMQIPLPKVSHQSENWSAGNLDKFRIQLPTEDYVEMAAELEHLDHAQIEVAGAGEIQLGDLDESKSPVKKPEQQAPQRQRSSTFESPATSLNLIDPVHAEQILREQVKIVLQDIAWKILPDMTERIVREELQKLLKDAEKLS